MPDRNSYLVSKLKEYGLDVGLRHQMNALRNAAPYIMTRGLKKFLRTYYTFVGRIYANWWGIKLGRGTEFFGLPIFERHPSSTISIGEKCMFISSVWRNMLGGIRPCTIQAWPNVNISVGAKSGFSSTVIVATKAIEIGSRVTCGTNCTIMDWDGHVSDPMDRANGNRGKGESVIIEDDVWLSQNVLILKGVRIGKGTVIAANSVVNKNLPEFVLAGGVPARIIKDLK